MQRERSQQADASGASFWQSRPLAPMRRLVKELNPAIEIAGAIFTHFFQRTRARRHVLKPYTNITWKTRLLGALIFPFLFLFCLVYGFFFALTAPYLIVPCTIPVLVVALLAIWALPDERVAPLRLMRFLLSGYLVSLILWPNYLAISLPGLPWMTFLRLFGIPLTACMLVSLSISRAFRVKLFEILNATPIIWRALAVFVAMQFITIPLSKELTASLNRTLIYQVNWTTIFVYSAYMFSKPRRISRHIALMCLLAVPIAALSWLEFKAQHLLWDGHVPSFLKVDDLGLLLTPKFRPGTLEYRAKVVFTTALGLAQFMAVLTPFFIHYVVSSKKILLRMASAGMLIMLSLSIGFSGSRLGYVGMMLSVLLYTLTWAYTRWRRLPSDLLAPIILFGYPFFFGLVLSASLFVNRIHDRVWGGGAQASSTEARGNQIKMALPNILHNPIGHGSGMSGSAMGYAEGSFVTVDNYLLSLSLDYGVIGLVAYCTAFFAAIGYAFRYAVLDLQNSRDPEAHYIIPLAISVADFMVIKLVFSQTDLDPLLFMELGMIVALIARHRREKSLRQETRSQVLKAARAFG